MRNPFAAGLRRPRAALTLFGAFVVAGTAGSWLHGRVTRVASSYAYVRGDVVRVGAPLEGQLASVEVAPGDAVRRGDVLARLDAGAIAPAVEQAQATHERARRAVVAERRTIEVERQRIGALRARLRAHVSASRAAARAARVAWRHARRDADRSRRLASRSALAIAELDAADALAETSGAEASRRRAELDVAEAELAGLAVAEAELAAREERVALLEADAVVARAALAAARARLEQTIVRAQHDGRITRRILAPGASIRVGDPIVEMWLDGPVAVEAWLDERKLGRVHLGAAARVVFEGLPGTYAGRVESIGMVGDDEVRAVSVTVPVGNRLAKSRWVRLHVALDRPDARLMPGLTADVTFPGGSAPSRLPAKEGP